MKPNPEPLQKVISQISTDLAEHAAAPASIQRFKTEAAEVKRRATPDDEESMRLWRSMEDRVEIAENLLLRSRERLEKCAIEAEEAVVAFANEMAAAGKAETESLIQTLVKAVEPYCVPTQNFHVTLSSADQARAIVTQVNALHRIPTDRHHWRLLQHVNFYPDSAPEVRAGAALEAGNKLLKTFEEWQRNGGKFFVPGKH